MPVVVTQLIVDASGAKMGVAEFEAAMDKAKKSAVDSGVATATAFEKAQQRWSTSLAATDPLIKAQIAQAQAMARQQNVNTDAVKLGITTNEAAAVQLDKVRQKHDAIIQSVREQTGQLNTNEKALVGLKNATSGVSGQLIALSAGSGPVGVFLSALGPWGLAAAVGIGALAAAFNHMIAESARMGDSAIEARKFADVTGLTIEQIKGLTKVAANLGVDGEKVTGAIEKFTIGLEEARKGTGALFDKVREINPELAMQLALSKTTAEGIDAYARALKNASTEAQRQSLGRAGLGRGGSEVTLPLVAVADLGGLDAAAEKTRKVTGLTGDWVREVAHLREQNIQLEKQIANTMASAYAKEVLERQNQFLKVELEIARATVNVTNARARAGHEPGDEFSMQRDTAVTRNEVTSPAANDNASQVTTTTALSEATHKLADTESLRSKALADQRREAVLASNLMKEQIGLLGTAATFEDRRIAKLKELTAAMLENKFAANDPAENQRLHNRAVEATNLDSVIQKTGALNSVLGVAATVQDQYRARLQQIAKAQMEGAGATDAQVANAKRLALAHADGTFALQAQINATQVQTRTIGMGIGEAETFQIIQTKINENLNAGKPALDGVSAGFMKLATSAGVAKQAEAELKAQNDATFALQTVLLSDTEKQIASVNFQLHGNKWKDFMDDGLSSTLRLVDSLKILKDAAGTFASGLARDLATGVPAVEALQTALKTLASSVLDAAVKRLVDQALSGLASALTGAAGGAVAGASQAATMTTGATSAAGILTSAGATVAASIVAGATEAASILGLTIPPAAATLPAAAAVAGTEVAAGGVTAGAAVAAGGAAVEVAAFSLSAAMGPIALAFAAIAAIGALIGLGGSSKGDTWYKNQVEGMNSRNADYGNRIALAGINSNTREGAIAIQDARNTQERLAENKAGGQAMNALLQAQVEERNALLREWDAKDLEIIKSNADAKLALEKAAADRSLDFQNRLFAATNDFETLEGQLKAFDRAAIQERAREVETGGQAIVDLEAAQAAERFNVIRDYNKKIVADTEATAKAQRDALNSAAKSIIDYVKNLSAGQSSTDSPQNVFNASQAAYFAKLALAQGGNVDAQSTVTQDAENYRLAARALFASGTGYQDILLAIKTQLLALPAVQTTTDPVLQAMRDVLKSINDGNATQATDTTLQGMIKTAIDAGNASAIASALLAGGKIPADGLNFTDFVRGLGPSYAAVATNVTVGGLLTNTQLTALGLSKDLTTGALFTNTQLQNAGLSKDATVGGLLTSEQIKALGLSTDSTIGDVRTSIDAINTGNILKIFQELDGNGNGILEKSEVIKNASVGTDDKAQISVDQTHNAIVLQDTANTLTTTANGLVAASNGFLTAINTFADRIIRAINSQGQLQQDIGNQQNSQLAILLHWQPKLVYGGKGELAATGADNYASIPYQAHASGGVIPAHGLGLVSEHLNPTWVRAGNEPITVSPFPAPQSFRGSNDNGGNAALIAEVRELRNEVVRLQKIVMAGDNMNAQATVQSGGAVVDAVETGTKKTGEAMRLAKRDQRAA